MFDLNKVINGLAKKRPVFHSEADFQHALAWEIHETHKDLGVRLEYPLKHSSEEAHVDIMLFIGKKSRIAIELKYKTSKPPNDIVLDGELFDLKNQSAHGSACYDFWRDVERLEKMRSERKINKGFVVFCTNDMWYCDQPNSESTNEWPFRITQDRSVNDRVKLKWSPKLLKTTKNKEVHKRKKTSGPRVCINSIGRTTRMLESKKANSGIFC